MVIKVVLLYIMLLGNLGLSSFVLCKSVVCLSVGCMSVCKTRADGHVVVMAKALGYYIYGELLRLLKVASCCFYTYNTCLYLFARLVSIIYEGKKVYIIAF